MAKHNCAICGAEVGLMSEQKLADGNFICRKVCAKKCYKALDLVSADLDTVKAHHEQIDFGTKVWNQIFVPLKKTKNKEEKLKSLGRGEYIYVSPSTGLIAYTDDRYKIFLFGKTTYACVYRIADLYGYEYEEEKVKNSEGKEETKCYCRLLFHNTAGLYSFRIGVSGQKDYDYVCKYFDTLFGIQKTLRNSMNNAKRQLNALKGAASIVKGAVSGTIDEAQAAEAVGAVDAYFMGDRTEWIAKADAALAPYKK